MERSRILKTTLFLYGSRITRSYPLFELSIEKIYRCGESARAKLANDKEDFLRELESLILSKNFQKAFVSFVI